MKLLPGSLFHFYNQGNNREIIFKEDADYILFLKKFRFLVLPHCDILAWTLMPNHFHFLIYTSDRSLLPVKLGAVTATTLSNGFRLLLSEYAKDFNLKYKRSGSLFRQKTKAKWLDCQQDNYPLICFNYIHQNPLKAGLIKNMCDWKFSSLQDYIGQRKGTICNKILALDLLGITQEYVEEATLIFIDKEQENNIF